MHALRLALRCTFLCNHDACNTPADDDARLDVVQEQEGEGQRLRHLGAVEYAHLLLSLRLRYRYAITGHGGVRGAKVPTTPRTQVLHHVQGESRPKFLMLLGGLPTLLHPAQSCSAVLQGAGSTSTR